MQVCKPPLRRKETPNTYITGTKEELEVVGLFSVLASLISCPLTTKAWVPCTCYKSAQIYCN